MNISENLRVLIGYGSGMDSTRLRQTVLGAGLECIPEDCVTLAELEGRLAQGSGDLVMVAMGDDGDRALETVRTSARFGAAPVWAIGPTEDSQFVIRTLRSGAQEYLSSEEMRSELDAALEKWKSARLRHKRGVVISVYAPVPGSGATTVATNLAAALGKSYPKDVALVELQRDGTDLACLLDFVPQHTVAQVCQRWEELDRTCLESSFLKHHSGIKVLAQAGSNGFAGALKPEAIRRVAILSRTMHLYTVLDLDSHLWPEQIEAMRLCDLIAFVVRPDVPGLRRARRSLDELASHGVSSESLRLVINRTGQAGGLSVQMVEKTLGLPVSGAIPDAPAKVNRAANQGALLAEYAPAARINRSFRKLANELNGKS